MPRHTTLSLLGTLVFWAAATPCFADAVTTIADAHGCKTDNPFPKPDEAINWTGGCKKGYLDGHGTLLWIRDGKPGDRYEGTFANGELVGTGTLTKPDGAVLQGSFNLGRLQGPGTATYANGTVLSGNFVAGQLNGEGSADYADGGHYQGMWQNGVRSGHGVLTQKNGFRYDGEWADNLYSGHGVTSYANGDRYDGAYLAGKREGYGVYEYANGSRYFGDFKANLFDGHGVTDNGFGLRTEGEYAKGHYIGDGLTRPDGQAAQAAFTDALLVNAKTRCNVDEVRKKVVYPPSAMRDGIGGGSVRAHFTADQSGRVDRVFLLQSTNAAFNETMLSMLAQLTCNGPPPEGGMTWDVTFKIDTIAMNSVMLLGIPPDIKDGRRVLILIESPDQPGRGGVAIDQAARNASARIATRIAGLLRQRRMSVENNLVGVPVADQQRLLVAASATAGARYVLVLRPAALPSQPVDSSTPVSAQSASPNGTDAKVALKADFYALNSFKDARTAKPTSSSSLLISSADSGQRYLESIVEASTSLIEDMDQGGRLATLQAVCDGHLCPADTTVIAPPPRDF
jgi:TonB family protein